MERYTMPCREGWKQKVEQIGLTYHSHENGPYWDESAYYEFTKAEIDELEKTANTLHDLCLTAAGAVIERGWWERLAISEKAIPLIVKSWERDDFSLYGRFDVAYDGKTPPKLLEYNADTPTALVEAAVAQWFWLQDRFQGMDQFNSIHERLVTAWKKLSGERIHFSAVKEHPEDEQTVLYLQDTCHQAGLVTKQVAVEDIGWNETRKCFADLEDQKIINCFKLYPWEWMMHEAFAEHLALEPARFIEPAWKMLLSNKGLLPILWELFPGHPNLLPAYDNPEPLRGNYVRKPKLSREGANLLLMENGVVQEETPGDYGEEGHVYQALAKIPEFDGNHPVLGLWIVDHEGAGLGIREDTKRVTGNLSRFVPHLFVP
ncbi:MAG TPA: glutathionylspermidine synthase family protein [Candidatus Saccharimonadales bacterium]|nr:glutathionylspermidine synthase family protein [Candidatus Saccharimonadales bacterium]